MDSKAICFLSLHELSAQLRDHKLSSAEVTRTVLDRIKQTNPKLRAYITVLEDSALSQAAQADKEIKAGRWRGPLHGVPVAVKDLCWTKGVPTTCASKVLRDWRPDSNATVVNRFEAAGAVLLGKLHLTEFAVIWYSPDFSAPLNPWDPSLWPGASSSGSGSSRRRRPLLCRDRDGYRRLDSFSVSRKWRRRSETYLGTSKPPWSFPAR
jgi:amidase